MTTIQQFDRYSIRGPIYRQIETYLREQIELGVFSNGDALPSVKELCKQFGGVNHLTVRQAIKALAQQGLVRTVHAQGTFVMDKEIRAHCIALVLPGLEDELTRRIAQGVQDVVETQNIKTLIMDSRQDSKQEVESIRRLQDLSLGGAIIFPIPYDNVFDHVVKLKLDGFPFVLIDRCFQDIETPAVVVDSYHGTYNLTAHLIDQGHNKIAWIGNVDVSSARMRFEGFRDALNDRRVFCDRLLVKSIQLKTYELATYLELIRIATRELMTNPPQPDAIVFVDDVAALVGMDEIKRLGFKMPQDVAVTGFDDIREAAQSVPPLTTIHQPMEEVGAEAAKLLLERLENPALPVRRIVLPGKLIVRESSQGREGKNRQSAQRSKDE